MTKDRFDKVIEKVTVTKRYETFDNKIFENKADADMYTRLCIIRHYFKTSKVKVNESVLEFFASKFDDIVNDFYEAEVFTEGFGTQDDF